MMLLAHNNEADCAESAALLSSMGQACLKLLRECVEHQELFRRQLSKAASQLEAAGMVKIRSDGDKWAPRVIITPALLGEEALEMLDQDKTDTPETTLQNKVLSLRLGENCRHRFDPNEF